MHAAVIEDGKVVNLIVVDSLDALPGVVLVEAHSASIGDRWDGERFVPSQPAVSLESLKAAKNAEINVWRAAANQATFPHAGKRIACDQLSRSDIDGVANHLNLLGSFPPDFPGVWRATDNTYLPMVEIDQFKAMYQSMAAQGTENFNHSQALKLQLALAETPDEVASIAW